MILAEIYRIEDMVQYLLPIAEGLLKGYCFYRYLEPFMLPGGLRKRKKGAYFGGAVYFLTILLFYTLSISRDVYVIYGMASLGAFLMICQMNRRNYWQKSFLVITFFSLSEFSVSMAEILYDLLYDSALKTDYMLKHPEMSAVLYVMMCVCYLGLELVFIAIGIRQVTRVYLNKRDEMEKKEWIMLVVPSLMGTIGYEIMRYYRVFYAIETGKMEKTYDSLMLLFCAVSSAAILVVILLYQEIKTKQKENEQAKLLDVQMGSIRRHIEQVEELYQNIHSIKHDMTNHILTLERLYEGRKVQEAKAYREGLKAELVRVTGKLESGNPVTDVILQEFAKEAKKRGISFHSEFYYPVDSKMDAFDISVILNNALQNAVEHTGSGKESQISLVSYRRDNAYIIEIENSFTGTLQWNAESNLPVTSKDTAYGHGYGLPNIRRVAEKYFGDIEIALKDGNFCLGILLMLE